MEHDVCDKKEMGSTLHDDMTPSRPASLSLKEAGEAGSKHKDFFQTPLNTELLLHNERGTLRSVDSGFSERSVFSLLGDETPGLSASRVPSGVEDNEICNSSGVDSLPDNNFSPTSHLHNIAGRARRLKFHPFDERPPAFQLLSSLEDDGEEGADERLSRGNNSLDSRENKGETEKQISASLVQNTLESEKSSSSSLSSSTDDLELSLQEMSLEESSSGSMTSLVSRTSPIYHTDAHVRIDQNSASIFKRDSIIKSRKEETQEPDLDFEASEALSSMSISPPVMSTLPSINGKEHSSSGVAEGSPHEQQEFLKSLSLTRRLLPEISSPSASTSACPEHPIGQQTAFLDDTEAMLQESSLDATLTFDVPHSPPRDCEIVCICGRRKSLHLSRVPLLPHEYDHFESECPVCSNVILESPGKSTSRRPSPDQEFMSLQSPSKAMKTSLLSPALTGNIKRVTRSPNKKAREKSSTDGTTVVKKKSVKRSIFSDSSVVSGQSPQSYNSQMSGSTNYDEKTMEEIMLLEEEKVDSFRVGGSESPFHGLVQYSPERKAHATHDILYRDGANNDLDLESLLEQVVDKFSPREPSRLIGCRIGVIKFDILGELSSKNFLFCVQQILEHLSDQDLDTMCQVSMVWKSALFNDLRASSRYKLYCALQMRQAVLIGKENAKEKSLESEQYETLTASKGRLTAVQLQAARPEHSSQEIPKPPLELLSGDKLRSCPHCQAPAKEMECQDRAVCSSETCAYDFCTLCFAAFHATKRCKPLCLTSSRNDMAGTRKSRKNLRRL
ncbi:uncharacterized protein LOC101858208 isoform X2 [Aplysia californica]|nr:uncharacterized protein LOC101858208 isoform X2 [Aplysia californica]